jgi:phosphoglycolate phosphatase-like HAD superfamily hydrolase
MLNTLLLFDVDGTLIKGARGARTAFARAIQACLSVEVDLSTLELPGRTDYWIMQEILRTNGLPTDQATRDLLQESFLEHFHEAVREQPGQVLPGVRPLLDVLQHKPATVLGLGTGNLQRSARMKLAAHGLDAYFALGGFGDDGLERNAIIAAGIARAQQQHRTPFDRVVVIGDTLHDIACAKANGAHSIAVATGPTDVDTLTQAGATVAFEDLSHTEEVVQAIDALPRSTHATG